MGGIKIQLLGIAIILAGIATGSYFRFYGAALGLAIAFGGTFWKDGPK